MSCFYCLDKDKHTHTRFMKLSKQLSVTQASLTRQQAERKQWSQQGLEAASQRTCKQTPLLSLGDLSLRLREEFRFCPVLLQDTQSENKTILAVCQVTIFLNEVFFNILQLIKIQVIPNCCDVLIV